MSVQDIIISILQLKKGLNEKKLYKKVLKKSSCEKIDFDQALTQLLNDKEILLHNEEYKINKLNSSLSQKKRKRIGADASEEAQADSDDDAEDLEDSHGTSKKIKHNKKVRSESSNDHSVAKKVWPYEELWRNGEKYWREGTFDPEYLRTNPDGVTRLFCGNLNRLITEEELKEFLPGITYIKWITDKETGEFYGSSFLEMKDPAAAALAVSQDKAKFMGRPLKIYYCPPRPGDTWPPKLNSANSYAGTKPKAMHSNFNLASKPKTERPEGCKKLFAGNLSYDIDDDTIVDFFKDCGTLVGLRWLTRKDTEEFRGCGYVEFSCPEEAEKAILLDGMELLGRPIRLDWTT